MISKRRDKLQARTGPSINCLLQVKTSELTSCSNMMSRQLGIRASFPDCASQYAVFHDTNLIPNLIILVIVWTVQAVLFFSSENNKWTCISLTQPFTWLSISYVRATRSFRRIRYRFFQERLYLLPQKNRASDAPWNAAVQWQACCHGTGMSEAHRCHVTRALRFPI